LTRDHPATRRAANDQWIELLQRQSLFPPEATLRAKGGQELISFTVTRIEKKRLENAA